MKSYHFTCHCHKCQDVQADHLKSSVICKCKGPIPIGKKELSPKIVGLVHPKYWLGFFVDVSHSRVILNSTLF